MAYESVSYAEWKKEIDEIKAKKNGSSAKSGCWTGDPDITDGCPQCGAGAEFLAREGRCFTCQACGYSKCS